MLSQALRTLSSKLTNIKLNHLNKPKPSGIEAEHSYFTEMINTGNDLFTQFFGVGILAAQLGISSFSNLNAASQADLKALSIENAKLITETENWIYRYMSVYPDIVMVLDEYETIENESCVVRSGAQFMFDLFKGLNTQLDDMLSAFKKETVCDIDSKINMAKKLNKFKLRLEEIPSNIPNNHLWWK